MRDRFCPLFFSLLLTAYKNGEGGLFQSRELSHANCKQHIPVPSSASIERVGEQASEITDRRDTLARVCGRSDFWGASSQSPSQVDAWCCSSSRRPFEGLHCVHLPAPTSYGYIEQTHEMSRVNGATGVHSVLRIYACFIAVYCLCE
jgi:hypothetical protein